MGKIKGWTKRRKNWWSKDNPIGMPYPSGIRTIRINKREGVWGKYEVEGVRVDGMSVSLNANVLREINTMEEAKTFAVQYMRHH